MTGASSKTHPEVQRLRATLRLCFEAERADALAARIDTDEPRDDGALAPVVRLARASYSTDRWLVLFRRGRVTGAIPLWPRPRLGAVPALSLALHLGLDLEVDTLARLFHCSTDEIGKALQQARQAVDPARVGPCPDFAAQIGRYRDPSPDRLQRLALLQHLEGCGRCQLAMTQARQTDERLLASIDEIERQLTLLPETTSAGRPLLMSPALLWGGITLLVLLLAGAGIAGARLVFGGQQKPVPLLATHSAAPPFSGWLLETSRSGNVEAVDLSSGIRRLLIPEDSSNSPASVALSPDKKHLAEMTYTSSQQGRLLRVFSLDGVKQREWSGLDQSGQYQLLGWLNANEVLVSRWPLRQLGEDQATFDAQLSSQSTLVAFDITSGAQHVLLQEQVDAVYASPDGHNVAVEHVAGDGTVTLEIRPVQGETLGQPTASEAHVTFVNSGSPVLWTPDSQRVVFWARGLVDPATNQTPFDVMTLNGNVTTFYRAPGNAFGSLLNISPDGKQIVYAEGTTGTSSAPWAYWRLDVAGGTPQKLLDGGDLERLIPVQRDWSPIVFVGTTTGDVPTLTNVEPFYLPKSQQLNTLTSVISYVTLAYDQNGKSLGPLLDQFTPATLIGWLPSSDLSATPPAQTTTPGPFQSPSKPLNVPSLTASSRLSPDGARLLAYDQQNQFSMSVSLPDPSITPPQMAGAPIDPSWLPDSSGVIGVQRHTTPNGEISRISIYGDSGHGTYGMTDFDPAELGNSTSAAYHQPMLSPNGLRYSYFVTDGPSVTLSVSGVDGLPQRMASWSVPAGAKVPVPLIASWVDNDTLIFSEPGEWSGGFPHQATLQRVTFGASGSPHVDPLLSWHSQGGEKGVLLQELRLSPDHSRLALRIRRLTGANASNDRFDSISVARTSDLTHSTEIARGVAGEGMSWAPDGSGLAAFVGGKLVIANADGHLTQSIDTGSTIFAYPVWVSPNAIWIQAVESNGKQVSFTAEVKR